MILLSELDDENRASVKEATDRLLDVVGVTEVEAIRKLATYREQISLEVYRNIVTSSQVLAVLEQLLEDFPHLDADYIESMQLVVEDLKERGNLK